MKKLIVANWKMNPVNIKEAQMMFLSVKKGFKGKNCEVVVCPPFCYLAEAKKILGKSKNVFIGSQNCFWENKGSYTGEVSPLMLFDLGVQYVILGHSERMKMGETTEIIAKKLKAVLGAGLLPIVCVGDSLEEKQKGATFSIIEKKVKEIFTQISVASFSNIIIAYEPDWAIGTNNNCSPDDALSVALFIKKILAESFGKSAGANAKVIYGGSVNTENSHEYLLNENIVGLLIGGASLDIKEFLSIAKNV